MRCRALDIITDVSANGRNPSLPRSLPISGSSWLSLRRLQTADVANISCSYHALWGYSCTSTVIMLSMCCDSCTLYGPRMLFALQLIGNMQGHRHSTPTHNGPRRSGVYPGKRVMHDMTEGIMILAKAHHKHYFIRVSSIGVKLNARQNSTLA
jgi:hypothetical protein